MTDLLYHRITSPTLQIPTDPANPIPVGLLACQRDPLLRQLSTTVIGCTVSQPTATGKKSKKTPSERLVEVILHDTILFPEGGGQPSDIGFLTSAEGNKYDVIEVKRHGGHAVHYVRPKDIIDDNVLRRGENVLVELGKDGWDRRYDHMSMHTSQHLLSAVLETHLSLPTLSWSLTTFPSPCYVDLPRTLTTSEITFIQDEANRLVFEGRAVHVEVEELDRKKPEDVQKLETGRAAGKALPGDYTGGVKRVVVIEGVDRNPCCGTHLPSINNLQLFLIPPVTNSISSTTSPYRLCFLSGPRLINHLASTHSLLTSTSTTLSCGLPHVPSRVAHVVEERKKAEKRVADVENELAVMIAKGMVKEKCLIRHIHRMDDSGNALGFLSSISTAFINQLEDTQDSYLVVLSSSPSMQTSSSTSLFSVFGSDETKVKAAGDGLKAKLGVKGGGKGLRWSGKFVGVWKDGKEDSVVDSILAGIE